jgi:hypothetical protein
MLNEAERSQAEAYGWIVCRVFDSKTERVTVQVLPAANNAVKNAEDLMKVVIHRAQANDPFAQRVLKLVMDSMNPPEPGKRKKA